MGVRFRVVEAVRAGFEDGGVADTARGEAAAGEVHVPGRLQSVVIRSFVDAAFCETGNERR